MRIDKFISSARTDLSRADVKKLVRQGRVKLNGKKVKTADVRTEETDDVRVDGQPVIFKEHIYIMLNKPQGYICATKGRNTVLDLVPDELKRRGIFPAGRLDKDTEGFVLLTDDGELAHKMLSPKSHVPKTYFVTLEKTYDPEYEKIFEKGVTIDGGEVCKSAFSAADPEDKFSCTLVLHEGKFHQVKRMFEAVGNKVVYLKRTKIGALELDEKLEKGCCLEILHKDVEKLLTRTE